MAALYVNRNVPTVLCYNGKVFQFNLIAANEVYTNNYEADGY